MMTDQPNPNPQSSSPIVSIETALEVICKGKIEKEHGLLRWSSNYAFLLALRLEDVQVTAVYKPQKGERPLWDFPDGTLCYREYASFLTSQELGWQIVPPTALREGARGIGTMQFFIDHDSEVNYFTFDETMHSQLRRIVIFDAAELPFLRDAMIVHNHPVDDDEAPAESQTFSSLDLVFAIRYNVAESRVVAGEWRFVIRRPATGWPADEEIVLAVYNEMSDTITREFAVAVAEGRMEEEEREVILPHEAMRRVADWGQFAYLRERMP